MKRARNAIVARLGDQAIALVSDAGTPLISDPGYKLVRDARAAGHAVFTLPGPCAAIAALTLAGLPTDRFLFLGFLPAKAKARDRMRSPRSPAIRATLVFYESGPRLGDTLAALGVPARARDAAVARELTKLHEECVTGTLDELAERYADAAPKGEIVIVVGPPRAARRGQRCGARRGARRSARAAVAVAGGRRSRRAPRACRGSAPTPARSSAQQMNRQAAEQRGRGAETIACWWLRLARLAHPRPARAGAGRRGRSRRASAAERSPSSRSRRAPATMPAAIALDEWRLRRVAAGRRAAVPRYMRGGDDVRIDAILIVPRRWPRHLVNVWQG